MSSAVLYLAIVAVWAVVLVPMWLRRDGESTGISRLLHKRAEEEEEPADEQDEPATPARRRSGRAAVIARRRRRTSGLTLLLATSIGVGAAGYAPWWVTLPPVLLLAGHMALLRVAVGMDAAHRREQAARARAAAQEARRAAAAQQEAEVIELAAPAQDEVFDQYADDRRAVGE
ncbi:hypothetical protein [Actinomadura rugatobispora]|uniref:Uncharacterized protein n=1 Tax=Actinomadura rugatobispora TaxID=1994 RepID=A0ABW0ZNY4_9ACTN|nr:hypothetical protein GCM10010200_060010 [Actinomadura rugatobispora]